jgi:hypothetical protein
MWSNNENSSNSHLSDDLVNLRALEPTLEVLQQVLMKKKRQVVHQALCERVGRREDGKTFVCLSDGVIMMVR